MKKTITKQLEEALREIEYQKGRVAELSSKLDKLERDKERRFLDTINETSYIKTENRNLLEIIRWHINSETAKYPFEVEKSQRRDSKFN